MKLVLRVFTVVFLVLPIILLPLSCDDGREGDMPPDETEGEHSGTVGFLNALSPAELNYLHSLQGVISVAMNEAEFSYQVNEDGSISGFDYYYALALGEQLGLDVHFIYLDTIPEFFAKDGVFNPDVITDSSISYTPDVFSRAQIIAAPFAINEWRQRLCTMVPLFPVGVVLIGTDASRVTSYQDLQGHSIAVRAGDFQIDFLNSIAEQYNLTLDLREYPDDEDVFTLLRNDFADYTIDGSVFLAQRMQEIVDLEVSPLQLSLIPVGWGIARDNQEFTSIFRKFVAFSFEQGILQKIWTEQMGVDFDFYLNMVGES